MQMAAVSANRYAGVKHICIEAGRGTGKSTILGWFVKEAAKQMPRATGVLVGATFVQIKSRTFPSTKEGLEMFGFSSSQLVEQRGALLQWFYIGACISR